ncbi:MAG TPA: c-type cytochrome [Terracidiphilus sp.]|nr:c-type cytochrome [Terracidiphilus sp.]
MKNIRTHKAIRYSVIIAVVLAAVSGLSAQQQPEATGPALFAANCAACHGSDGRGGERAPDIATRREIVSFRDSDLFHIVSGGVSGTGMPPFAFLGPDKIKALVAYLRLLQGVTIAIKVPGNPSRGRLLFYGKAGCSACHMVDGNGGFIASDLTLYRIGHTPQETRNTIIDPDAGIARAAQIVMVMTAGGKQFSGFIRSEDNFYLILQDTSGNYRSFPRSSLVRIELTGHSSMPRDYGARLNDHELDDLVSFLLTSDTLNKTAKRE